MKTIVGAPMRTDVPPARRVVSALVAVTIAAQQDFRIEALPVMALPRAEAGRIASMWPTPARSAP